MMDLSHKNNSIKSLQKKESDLYCDSFSNLLIFNQYQITLTNQTFNIINKYRTRMKAIQVIFVSSFFMMCISYPIIQIFSSQSHNKNCYTQGLFFLNDSHVFQTCGLYGKSYFHILQYTAFPFQLRQKFSTLIPWKSNIFLQGAIQFKNYLYLLTWQERIVYKLDPSNYNIVKQLRWQKDGWGLTTNGTHMFTTDGSENIYLVDQNFVQIQRKPITGVSGYRQANINQLEYVNGSIYANIYLDSKIVRIDYEKGVVVEQISGSKLIENEKQLKSDEVINGIAYDKVNDFFIMTGKHWSKFYQVKLTQFLSQSSLASFLIILAFSIQVLNL